MKASFIKRIGSYFIDYFIIILIVSIITMGFSSNTGNITNRMNDLISDYQNEIIDEDEYLDSVNELNYELQKSNVKTNIVSITLYIGYYVVFATLNRGQTLGKKLLKIKVVNKNNEKPSVINMLVRSLLIYNIVSALYSVIFVNFLGVNTFMKIYTIIGYAEYFIILVSFFMVTYKKDGRGLHDMIAGTSVIDEVKK